MKKKFFYFILFTLIIILFKDNVYAYNSYHAGDKIRYKSNDYYVLENSDEASDYVYLLKSTSLNSTELYQYSQNELNNFIFNDMLEYSKDGRYLHGIPYYKSDKCNNNVKTECYNVYEKSFIKQIINNWEKDNFNEDELKNINGYSAKILSNDDIINLLHYEIDKNATSLSYKITDETYNIIPENEIENIYGSWIMSTGENTYQNYSFGPYISTFTNVFDEKKIVPTIYLKKCYIDGSCINKKYNEYQYGDKVNLRGDDYYVIEDSNENNDYITVIKDKPLNVFDVKKYDIPVNGQSNKVYYDYNYQNSNCSYDNFTLYYIINYNDSTVKTLIDGWANGNFYTGELKKLNGYKARVLDESDLVLKSNQYPNNEIANIITNNQYKTLLKFDNEYECNNYKKGINIVNPVINLKKCALEGTCTTTEKEEYKAGDVITYKGQTYHVLKDSDKYSNYVTLFKDEPLNNDEAINNLGEYYSLFSSNIIKEISGKTSVKFAINTNGTISNNYQNSIIDTIVSNWANQTFENNLVYKDKYAARILSTDDLVQYLGFEWGGETAGTSTSYTYLQTDYTPSWFKDKDLGTMWLMTPFDDSNTSVWGLQFNRTIERDLNIDSTGQINPVVNVNKCLLNPNADSCQKCVRVNKENNVNISNYKEYDIGDIVTYNGNEYYVYEYSNKKQPYLKLLKKEPLTANEINTYGKDENSNSIINRYTFYSNILSSNNIKNGIFAIFNPSVLNNNVGICSSENDKDCNITSLQQQNDLLYYYKFVTTIPGYSYEYENGYGGMQYYSDEHCHLVNNTTRLENSDNNCDIFKDYKLSNVKTVVNNWSNQNLNINDLVNINGYTSRIMSYEELHEAVYHSNEDNPDYLLPNKYEYWLLDANLSTNLANKYKEISIYGIIPLSQNNYQLLYPAVRPVIFLKKSALENGIINQTISVSHCKTNNDNIIPDDNDPEDPIIEDNENPNDPITVDVPNTKKLLSIISIVFSITLIGLGIYIIFKYVIKIKKNK